MMIKSDDFTARLEIIFNYYHLSASAFADKIGVQRSSISHLLSGRNKPSLDFILKVVENFPEIDLLWLLNGAGSFPKIEESLIKIDLKDNFTTDLFSNDEKTKTLENNSEKTKILSDYENKMETTKNSPKHSEIERIVVFFTDGTFKNYIP